MSLTRAQHQALAGVRSDVYAKLSALLTYPSNDLLAELTAGTFQEHLKAQLAGYPLEVCLDRSEVAPSDCESEYLRLFELPVDGPPCPLYGGLLGGDRRTVMEELLRLYRHFGLSTANAETRDLPDSLPTVLEFLCFLAYRESTSADIDSTRAGQRDLLKRYLVPWLGTLQRRVAERRPLTVYEQGLAFTRAYVETELELLSAA